MGEILLEPVARGASRRRFEIVERKGLGHPDSICDAVVEEAARTVAREYLGRFGRVLHFNLDKAFLSAGAATPRFGGGTLDEPMLFVYGDRAEMEHQGVRVHLAELVEQAARRWLKANLPALDPAKHVVFQCELRRGSPELSRIYGSRGSTAANDTSTGVGFAPLTETERLVLECEHYLNGRGFKARFPETGQDIKVMAVRRDARLDVTIALAFIDRALRDERAYRDRKRAVMEDVTAHLRARLASLQELSVRINTLDEPGLGEAGAYLTVTGTSAESADSGQVGRGNRLPGFVSATRPWSAEAVAGKNPLCHVGKIYNHIAQRLAMRVAALECVAEANVFLVSRIGEAIERPQSTTLSLELADGVALGDVRDPIERITEETLREIASFVPDWLNGHGRREEAIVA